MKIYYASASRIEYPDTNHSRSNLDFGRGFYTTTLKEQARDYAMRFKKRDHKAYVNTYDLYTDGLKDDQICFCTQEAIDKLLAFSKAEEVA